jgi:uncharacterized protein YcbK (DUF882 family)
MQRRRLLLGVAGLLSTPCNAFAIPLAPAPFRLRLLDAHSGAMFDGVYRDTKGPITRVMEELCVFFRDHHSGGVVNYDVGVIDFLAKVMAATGQNRAIVLSAFRSLETNEALARTNFGVAEHSQHIYGRALDVRFDAKLPEAMTAARAMRRGGVGWYPQSGFIHLDSGPVRNWDLGSTGLQDLLVKPAPPVQSPPKAETVANGPGSLVVEGKTPVLLTGRVSLTVR